MADPKADYLKWRESQQAEQETPQTPLATQPSEQPASTPDPTQRYRDWREKEQDRAAERAALIMDRVVSTPQEVTTAYERSDEARTLGQTIPPALLTNVKSGLAKRIEDQTRKAQLRSSSKLSAWVLEDPMNAALAKQEMQNLSRAASLYEGFAKGLDRTITGGFYRQRTQQVEYDLQKLQDERADRQRSFGGIMDDLQEGMEPDDFDANPGYTVAKTYATAAARYVRSRVNVFSDQGLEVFEEDLKSKLEERLSAEGENAARVERQYGSSATVARIGQRAAEIGELEGVGNQLSAFGELLRSEPGAVTDWIAYVVAESAPTLIAGAAVSQTTRNPRAGAAAMGYTSFTMGEASAFQQFADEAGYDLRDPEQRRALVNDPELRARMNDRAFTYGAVIGIVDAASGGIASKQLMESPVGDLMLQSMTQAAMGSSGEFLAQVASEQDINMVEVLVEGLAEFATAPLEAAGVGRRYAKKHKQTRQDRAFFDALRENAEESEMKAKLPRKYREVVERLTRDGPVETVYVDAKQMEELFQSDPEGVTADQFIAAMPGGDTDAYARALEEGGLVEIPTSVYAADVVGTRFDELLRNHLKTAPENMSAAELKEYRAQVDKLAENAAAAAERAETGQAELEGAAETARVELVSALRRAGRRTETAETEALQAVAFARTMSERLGIPLDDFLARYPLADVQGALESAEGIRTTIVTPETMEMVKNPDEAAGADRELIEAMREAAEVSGLELETAEPADLERAIAQAYGPAAGPVMLNQLERSSMRPAAPDDLDRGMTRDFLRREGWGVVTAARGDTTDAEQNAALEQELQERGIEYRRMEGVYEGEPDGASFMIFADRDTVVELGQKYGQESVLTRAGLVFMDGSPTTPLDRNVLFTGDEARGQDFYSTMADGSVWSAGFAESSRTEAYDVEAIEARAEELATEMEPLSGAPRIKGAEGPDPMLNAVAEAYAVKHGVRGFRRQAEFVKVDEERAKRIADAYEEMPHTPDSRITQNAYKKLIEQTMAQYEALVAAGYEFYFMDPDSDPYNGNPAAAMRELRSDRSMAVYPTEDGYGSGASDVDTSDNPLLVDTGLQWSFGEKGSAETRRVTANDLFRAVHDAFGHGLEGAGFRARGEENAWQAHARLFTGWAVAALTTETRGQNSWLNYGPHGEANRTASVEETVFADQKAGLMPEWTWKEGRAADVGLQVPVNADGTVTLTHWSNSAHDTIDPEFAGTGPLRGVERKRRGPRKAFYGVNVGKLGGYQKENLGSYRHEVHVPSEQLYDLDRDPDAIVAAIPENVPSFQRIGWVEEQIKERGYKGYVVMSSPHGSAAALFEAAEPTSVRDDRTVEFYQSGATPDFFSALTREVANAKQKKAGAKDWKAIISKLPGVKKAEIEWSGVNEWLDSQTGQIAREDVAAYLRDNEVEVETVTLAEDEQGDDFSGTGIPGYSVTETGSEVLEEDEGALEDQGMDIYAPELFEEQLSEIVDRFVEENKDDFLEAFPDLDLPGQLRSIVEAEITTAYETVLAPDDVPQSKWVREHPSFEVPDREQIERDATEMAREAYYEDPYYSYEFTIEFPDGDARTETVVGSDDAGYSWGTYTASSLDEVQEFLVDHFRDDAEAVTDGDEAARWGEYTEPGGADYREVLLTVPFLEDRGPNAQLDVGGFVNASHFDVPNVVVHARLNYREDRAGKKVLFVEEVQSDLGSHWREQGGQPTSTEIDRGRQASEEFERLATRARELRAEKDRQLDELFEPVIGARRGTTDLQRLFTAMVQYREMDGAETREAFLDRTTADRALLLAAHEALPEPGQEGYEQIAEIQRTLNELEDVSRRGAEAREERAMGQPREPLTPFEGEAYYALMMKKLLKLAAEEGADKLAWTPAYMQARRWSGAVQNVVRVIEWDKGTPYSTIAEDGTTGDAFLVRLEGENGADDLLVNDEGVIVEKASTGGRIPESEVAGKKLSELIGTTMANRILGEEQGTIEGQNIVIGGDGYKIAYDQQIKKFVEKFARKYGGKLTVDKTMPDFVTGSNSTPVARVVAQYGHANVLNMLRESGLRDQSFWDQFDKKLTQDLADERRANASRLAENEAELARIDADIAARSPDDLFMADLAEKRQKLEEMTERRREVVRNYDDPDIVASTAYTRIIGNGYLTERQVLSVLPEEAQPTGDAVWSVSISDDMRAAASEAQPLFQRRPEGTRGSVLLPTEPGRAPLVTLFPKADLSTFLHESGHYYLHVLQDINARGDAPEGVAQDWQTIRAWWGQNVEGIAKDGDVTQEQVRAYMRDGTTGDLELDRKVNVGLQEQWARAYEAYLLEGKAPSNALRAAFEKFSAWLLSVYRGARDLDVEISDELRGVFDRMLATDSEIATATEENGFDQLVAESAEALGVEPEEYEKLRRLSVEAQDEARQEMLKTTMAPIRAQRTAEYKAARVKVEDDIRKKVQAKAAHRVREWLGNDRWLGDDAPEQIPADLRMDRQMFIDEHGEELLNALPRGKRPLVVKGSGLSADDVAGWFGYSSGSEMINDLVSTPKAEDEIKTRTDAEMRKSYPDPMTDGTVEDAAIKAIHGEKRGQLLAAELRAIGKTARGGKPTSRRQAAEVARRVIRQMPVRRAVRSNQYLEAERRAGRRATLAVAEGNMDEAFAAKREQLLNHQLFVESKKASEILGKVERRVAKLKKKSTRQNLAGEYLAAIDDILLAYDFRKSVTRRQERRREGLTRYLEMMREQGREGELAIPAHVLDETKRKPYRTLPLAELEGVLDSLRNIEHTARMKQKLRDAQAERDMTETVDGITAEMDENLKDGAMNRVATPKDKRRQGTRAAANLLLNADTLLRKLAGWDRGAAYEALKAPIDAAADKATVMREEASDAFEALYSVYSKREQRRMAVRRHHPELSGSFSKWDMISMALNMGNADNMARLMDKDSGGGFNAAQVEFVKQQLDKRDWDFVQSAWDMIEGYWPMIAERERRLTGVAPKKVAASEVETPYGTYQGGYYPIKYRGDVSGVVSSEELVEIQQNMMAGRYGKAQTRNGHLEERASGSGGRMLQLGIEVMHQHIGQVVHDLAFSEPTANTWRVLRDPRVREAFERKGLLEDLKTLEMWVQDVATGQIAAGGVLGRVALRAKNGFTLSKLAFNMSTVMIQMTGITQSMVVVGSKNMAIGYGAYLSNPASASRHVTEVSPFMAERETTFNRDINDILGDVMVGPAASRAQRFQQGLARVGFWLMQKVQFYGVDVPTWYGAYHDAVARYGEGEKAYAVADRAVARAQASGVFSDRSAFERGTLSYDTRQNGFVRLFTALGSYMFAKGNVAAEVYGRTARDMDGLNLRSITAAVKGASDMALLFTLEAIAYNLIKGTLPGMGDDDDDESWSAFLAKETALSMMSTMPVARDLGSSLSGFDAGAYGSVISTFSRPLVQASQGEADLALFKALSNAAGVTTGIPSGQLNRVVDAWYRLEEGEDVSPIEFIMGRR